MTHDTRDPILGLLARLPSAAPSTARSTLVRARALVALEKRRQTETVTKQTLGGRAVDGVLYFACIAYIAAAAIEVLKLGWPAR